MRNFRSTCRSRLFRLVIGSGGGEHPRVRVGDVGVDALEGGMVEHVGQRSCEGGAEALGDLEAFGKAYVLYFDAIAFERIRAGIAESSLLRYSECGRVEPRVDGPVETGIGDRKSTRLNSSHLGISY